MYVRPGVYIYQQYENRPVSTETRPSFAPAVLGVSMPVVEGTRAYAGSFDTSTSAENVTFIYPQLNQLFDQVMTSQVRVFLAPSGGTQPVRIESFTRDYLKRFGIKREFEGPVADVTDVVKNYTWTDQNGQARQGIETLSVTIPTTFDTSKVKTYNGFQFDTNGKPIYPKVDVYIEYRAYRQSEVGNVVESFNITDSSQTVFELTHTPVESVTATLIQGENSTDITSYINFDPVSGVVMVSGITLNPGDVVEFRYVAINPVYYDRKLVRSLDEIVKYYGAPHPYNPVALGAYLALSNAGGPVYVMAVPSVASGTTNLDTTALDKALAKMGTSDIYAIAVMDSAKRVSSVAQTFVETYSDPSRSNVKIAMLGFDGHRDIADTTDPELFKKELIRFAYSFDSARIRLLANPYVDIDLFGTVYPVAGYFYTAIYAGQVGRLMNTTPSRPLTNTIAPVVGERFLPTGIQFFSEGDLDDIAGAGYWILVTDVDGVRVRHQLTTAERDYARREDSIIRAVDYFSMALKTVLKQVVGVNTLTSTFINDTLLPIVNEQIRNAISRGICGVNTTITDVKVEAPDTVSLTIEFEPPFPANVIKITLVI